MYRRIDYTSTTWSSLVQYWAGRHWYRLSTESISLFDTAARIFRKASEARAKQEREMPSIRKDNEYDASSRDFMHTPAPSTPLQGLLHYNNWSSPPPPPPPPRPGIRIITDLNVTQLESIIMPTLIDDVPSENVAQNFLSHRIQRRSSTARQEEYHEPSLLFLNANSGLDGQLYQEDEPKKEEEEEKPNAFLLKSKSSSIGNGRRASFVPSRRNSLTATCA